MPPAALMYIRGLELNVNLGWEEQERQQAQTIKLDLEIYFDKKPKACLSDNLLDTICYYTLCNQIKECITNRSFALVEHLAQVIFDCVLANLSNHHQFKLHILKFPAIEGLTQGVRFTLNHRLDAE